MHLACLACGAHSGQHEPVFWDSTQSGAGEAHDHPQYGESATYPQVQEARHLSTAKKGQQPPVKPRTFAEVASAHATHNPDDNLCCSFVSRIFDCIISARTPVSIA